MIDLKVKENKKQNRLFVLMKFKHVRMTRFTFIILIFTGLIFITSLVGFLITLGVKEFPDSIKSTIVFQLVESIIMFGLILVPTFIKGVSKRCIPVTMEILYIVFCTGSIIFGEIYDFYGKISWWDSLLHSMSGVLLGILGYMIINTFNELEEKKFKFSPIFVALWVICFAIACGVIWELFEFMCDGLLGTNMQQFKESTSTLTDSNLLAGHQALQDTMKDLALDLLGAMVAAVVGYMEMKRNSRGISTMDFEKVVEDK